MTALGGSTGPKGETSPIAAASHLTPPKSSTIDNNKAKHGLKNFFFITSLLSESYIKFYKKAHRYRYT
jgi:hypothetical protein